ncbi:ribonuclease P protein component [Kordiimonas lipolytica]|uniref:Ribonuclease P protein component n=1 Tax=Kordiimonas lipolytica TaxID=1662421 RepID=A0ABV8UCT0_9PROT|nr:ribonuclease P protein component [Kordiimonas lipolytica]
MTEQALKLARITKRPDYLAVANTRRKWVTPSFILQAKPGEGDSPPRAGFTVSKKVGKAVIRSRARRRLKEACRAILPQFGQAGWTYVLVGRPCSVDYDFMKMQADMKWALAKLHAGADLSPGKPHGKPQKTKAGRGKT